MGSTWTKNIKEIVKHQEWQRLRKSLVGTWKGNEVTNVKKLRKFLGLIRTTTDQKLKIIYNYLTGSGFRLGVISHPEITKFRAAVKKEVIFRRGY